MYSYMCFNNVYNGPHMFQVQLWNCRWACVAIANAGVVQWYDKCIEAKHNVVQSLKDDVSRVSIR